MTVLEHDVDELRDLVDGPYHPRSHRNRLHALENDHDARDFAAQALKEFRELRGARATRIREWGAFLLALGAIALSASGHF